MIEIKVKVDGNNEILDFEVIEAPFKVETFQDFLRNVSDIPVLECEELERNHLSSNVQWMNTVTYRFRLGGPEVVRREVKVESGFYWRKTGGKSHFAKDLGNTIYKFRKNEYVKIAIPTVERFRGTGKGRYSPLESRWIHDAPTVEVIEEIFSPQKSSTGWSVRVKKHLTINGIRVDTDVNYIFCHSPQEPRPPILPHEISSGMQYHEPPYPIRPKYREVYRSVQDEKPHLSRGAIKRESRQIISDYLSSGGWLDAIAKRSAFINSQRELMKSRMIERHHGAMAEHEQAIERYQEDYQRWLLEVEKWETTSIEFANTWQEKAAESQVKIS